MCSMSLYKDNAKQSLNQLDVRYKCCDAGVIRLRRYRAMLLDVPLVLGRTLEERVFAMSDFCLTGNTVWLDRAVTHSFLVHGDLDCGGVGEIAGSTGDRECVGACRCSCRSHGEGRGFG